MRIALSFFIICIMFTSCAPSPENSRKGIAGTWRLVSMTCRDQKTGAENDLWGRDPIGFLTYTPGGRMSAVLASASRKITAESAEKASPEEQLMLFRTSFAYAGTYTQKDTVILHHVEVASDPTWIGKDQVRYFHLEGNKLTITGPPLQTVSDPHPKLLKLVWERVE